MCFTWSWAWVLPPSVSSSMTLSREGLLPLADAKTLCCAHNTREVIASQERTLAHTRPGWVPWSQFTTTLALCLLFIAREKTGRCAQASQAHRSSQRDQRRAQRPVDSLVAADALALSIPVAQWDH